MDFGVPSLVKDARLLRDGAPGTSAYVHKPTVGETSERSDLDWLLTCPSDVLRDLAKQRMLVRRAFCYLSGLPYSVWADWYIADPRRRLLAAVWLGRQINGVMVTTKGFDAGPIFNELDNREDRSTKEDPESGLDTPS